MIGLRQSRSIQDEKLVEAIFMSGHQDAEQMMIQQRNLIIDARPTANAMANIAMGAGSESTENYRGCRKLYLGIDNIHVMRDSLNRIVDAISHATPNNRVYKMRTSRSNWLNHIQAILEGVGTIVRTIHYDRGHTLVHCSDGWDRTAQLTSLASLCLDPYYRTIEGFSVLVEKEWCAFGHKFADRCGHLTHERDFQVAPSAQASAAEATISSIQSRLHQQSSHVRETSPVFHQFLDCCYQLWTQAPWRFEFNERYLMTLHYNAYACQFGTFLCNTERERREKVQPSCHSIWPYIDLRKDEFTNPIYDAKRDQETDQGVIIPDTSYLKYWTALFCRREEDNFVTAEAPPASDTTTRHVSTSQLTFPNPWAEMTSSSSRRSTTSDHSVGSPLGSAHERDPFAADILTATHSSRSRFSSRRNSDQLSSPTTMHHQDAEEGDPLGVTRLKDTI
jgi:myotubularin-related protein 6/7/8